MEDFAVVIILIIVGILSGVNKKKKKAPKAAQAPTGNPVMPDAPDRATQAGSVRASKEAQFDKDMRAARQRAQEKRAAHKAAQSVPVAPTEPGTMLPPRPVAHVADHEGGATARPSMQPRVKTDAPAPLEAMEGVDPCHDVLYDEPRTELDDDYETETLAPQLESSDAAQELMRGIILSEVLTRPSRRWRTQHR